VKESQWATKKYCDAQSRTKHLNNYPVRSISMLRNIFDGAATPPGQAVLSKLENVSGRIPLPKGEGGAKHRVRGEEKSLYTPHPALRATLSLRERDSQNAILYVVFQIPNAFEYLKYFRAVSLLQPANLDSTVWSGGAKPLTRISSQLFGRKEFSHPMSLGYQGMFVKTNR
jgi:hypothetical protein